METKQKEKFTDKGDGTTVRSRTSNWFECKIRYEKVMEDGLQKKVSEWYAVDALSFSEAEERIMMEMSAYISGSFDVDDIKKAKYKEVFFSGDDTDDCWFRAKVAFITIDEKSKKEKKSYVLYLVQAHSLERARQIIDIAMGGSLVDYEIKAITDTQLIDLFEYRSQKFEKVVVDLNDRSACLGRRVAERVVKTWTEDYCDESTGEVTPLERNEIILERNTRLTEDIINDLQQQHSICQVKVYKNID